MESQLNAKKTLSMMLVEDETEALQLLSKILVAKYPDITHYSANSGKIGLEIFKAHQPDIVITDINMPDLNGNRLAEKILEINAGTKMIAVTGKSCNLDSDKMSFIFDHYIEKPVNFKELFTAIDQFIGEFNQYRFI